MKVNIFLFYFSSTGTKTPANTANTANIANIANSATNDESENVTLTSHKP